MCMHLVIFALWNAVVWIEMNRINLWSIQKRQNVNKVSKYEYFRTAGLLNTSD